MTTDPISAVPKTTGVLLLVIYGALVSHQIEVKLGAIGAVVLISNDNHGDCALGP